MGILPEQTIKDGATNIARKPNYDFERREREKAKAAESARKTQAKAEKKVAEQESKSAPNAQASQGLESD